MKIDRRRQYYNDTQLKLLRTSILELIEGYEQFDAIYSVSLCTDNFAPDLVELHKILEKIEDELIFRGIES